MSIFEVELWVCMTVVTACILTCACAMAWEMLAMNSRKMCSAKCPRLDGGCMGKAGEVCIYWREEK